MAGDWIKMRTALLTDPKLVSVTRELAGNLQFVRWVCPGFAGPGLPPPETLEEALPVSLDCLKRVTLSLCYALWSEAQKHGRKDGLDCVLDFQDGLDAVDIMLGVPGFATAMASVGWLREGDDGRSVILPNFCKRNTLVRSAQELRDANSERQRRWRERQSRNVTRNGDVTPRNAPSDVDGDVDEELESLATLSSKQPKAAVTTSNGPRLDLSPHVQTWNTLAAEQDLPAVRWPLSETRKKRLRARLKEIPDLWKRVAEELRQRGQWAREERFPKFDQVMQRSTLDKLLEGNYRRKRGGWESLLDEPEEAKETP